MRSIVNAWIADMKDDQEETMSCQVMTETFLDSKELNPEDMESEMEHREVPTEEAAVKSSGTMKKWHRGRYQATGRRGGPKELTRGERGSQRKLAVACKKVSHRTAVVRRKRNVFKKIRTQGNCGPRKVLAAAGRRMTHNTKVTCRRGYDRMRYDQDSVVQETRKGRSLGKRRWKGPECNNGIRDRGLRQQIQGSKRMKELGVRRPLCLRKERTITNGIGAWSSGQRSHRFSEGRSRSK
jgi:hypothetical protein